MEADKPVDPTFEVEQFMEQFQDDTEIQLGTQAYLERLHTAQSQAFTELEAAGFDVSAITALNETMNESSPLSVDKIRTLIADNREIMTYITAFGYFNEESFSKYSLLAEFSEEMGASEEKIEKAVNKVRKAAVIAEEADYATNVWEHYAFIDFLYTSSLEELDDIIANVMVQNRTELILGSDSLTDEDKILILTLFKQKHPEAEVPGDASTWKDEISKAMDEQKDKDMTSELSGRQQASVGQQFDIGVELLGLPVLEITNDVKSNIVSALGRIAQPNISTFVADLFTKASMNEAVRTAQLNGWSQEQLDSLITFIKESM